MKKLRVSEAVVMLFFPFHIGDWITGTKLMSAVEKGVYIDLLTYYYSVERPITEDECRRIARAYAGAEQDAMQYVLQNHFAYVDGAYVHKKCEEIISQTLEKQADISEKKRKAARARWNKEKQGIRPDQQNAPVDARAYAGAEQMQSTCNTDAMLTNNHKPITKNINNTNKQQTEVSEAKEASADESVCCVSSCEDNFSEDEVIDAPVKVQIETAQLEHLNAQDESKPLTLVEMIAACKTFGIRLSHTPKTEAIADRKTVTLAVLRECAKAWKGTNTGTGYFIGILENASKDPQSVLPHEKREKPELSAASISDKQAGYFASQLVRDAMFCHRFGKGFRDYETFTADVSKKLHCPEFFEQYKPHLQRMGFM